MRVIKNNPYRVIGLLVGAGAREERARVRKLRMLIEAEQEPPEDFSFPILGELSRNIDVLDRANLMLDLDIDRLNAAIFWFYDGGTADEPAFDYLKEGKVESAIVDCWNKTLSSNGISRNNCSAFHNLSTLKLSIAFSRPITDAALLEEAIGLKLAFLESEFCRELIRLATGGTFKTTKEALQIHFLEQLKSEIDAGGGIAINSYFQIVDKLTFSAKEDFIKGFIREPVAYIEKKIEEAAAKRKAAPLSACTTGKKLLNETKKSMEQLELALGAFHIKFGDLSDKVSEEAMTCAVAYFEQHREGDTVDAGRSALQLLKNAKELAVGEFARIRCEENIDMVGGWIEESQLTQKIGPQLKYIMQQVEAFAPPEESDTTVGEYPSYVLKFVHNCKAKLTEIKSILGTNDKFYQNLSQRIAFTATNNLIKILNHISGKPNPQSILAVRTASGKNIIEVVSDAMNVISTFDMDPDTRKWLEENRAPVSQVRSKLSVGTGTGSGGGCYIATMVYGSYNHPQVLVLRDFRDRILMQSWVGQNFVHLYYRYSPALVKKFENKATVNHCIRLLLNQIIKLIRK